MRKRDKRRRRKKQKERNAIALKRSQERALELKKTRKGEEQEAIV